MEDEHAESLARAVIGAALALLLVKHGGKLDASPGQPVIVTHKGIDVQPFDLPKLLANDTLTAEVWQQQCVAMGIMGIDLGPPAAVQT